MQKNKKTFLKPCEFAKIAGVTKMTVYRMVKKNKIIHKRTVDIKRNIIIPYSEYQRLLQKN